MVLIESEIYITSMTTLLISAGVYPMRKFEGIGLWTSDGLGGGTFSVQFREAGKWYTADVIPEYVQAKAVQAAFKHRAWGKLYNFLRKRGVEFANLTHSQYLEQQAERRARSIETFRRLRREAEERGDEEE